MDRESLPMKEFISAHAQAPSMIILGESASRIDAVIRSFRDFGGVNVYATFTDTEALGRIASTPRLGVVALGDAIKEASRLRIREELKRNHQGVLTSEPGRQYPSSDENIVRDVLKKLGMHEIWHGLTPADAEVVATIGTQSAPFKGTMNGPEARPVYDAMIEVVPAALDVTYEDGAVGEVNGVWCWPRAAKPNAVILYLHGGAYVLGSAGAYRHFAGQFAARSGVAVFVPDYGLAPERPFPAGVRDAHAVYQSLASTFSQIAVVGDSAGGGLALSLLALARADRSAGSGIAPAACVVMSPWTDLTLTSSTHATRADEDPFVTTAMLKSTAASYLGREDAAHPLASPLYGVLNGLAPTQVHVGTSEVLLDDSLSYARRAREQGSDVAAHVWQRMPHVFTSNLGRLSAADQAMDLMIAFLAERLKSNTYLPGHGFD